MRVEDERIKRPKDDFERARDAMRSLLTVAKSKMETGTGGDLPAKEIHAAKDYFLAWKKRKPFGNNKALFFFFTAIFTIIYRPDGAEGMAVFAVGLAALWGFYAMLESDKVHRVYVSEMLGNLANFTKEEVDIYLSGLTYDLWRIEGEVLKWKFGLVLYLLTVLSTAPAAFSPGNETMRGFSLGLVLMSSAVFFTPSIIKKTKKDER